MLDFEEISFGRRDPTSNKHYSSLLECPSPTMDMLLSANDTLSFQEMIDVDIKSEIETVLGHSDFNHFNFCDVPPLESEEQNSDNYMWFSNNKDNFFSNKDNFCDFLGGEALMVNPNSVMPLAIMPIKKERKDEDDKHEISTAKKKPIKTLTIGKTQLNRSQLINNKMQSQNNKSQLFNNAKSIKSESDSFDINDDLSKSDDCDDLSKNDNIESDSSNLQPLKINSSSKISQSLNFNQSLKSNQALNFNPSLKSNLALKTNVALKSNLMTKSNQSVKSNQPLKINQPLKFNQPLKSKICSDNTNLTSKSNLMSKNYNLAKSNYLAKSTYNLAKSTYNLTSKSNVKIGSERIFPKPAYSYSCLIAMALKNSKSGSLPVSEIYNFMIKHFPYFKTAPTGWKNSVRHNLSLNKCFEKIEKPTQMSGAQRKGCLWAMNPSKIGKMDEEVQKWSRKDPSAIRKAMVNPDTLEALERGELKYSYSSEDNYDSTADSNAESNDESENEQSDVEIELENIENNDVDNDEIVENDIDFIDMNDIKVEEDEDELGFDIEVADLYENTDTDAEQNLLRVEMALAEQELLEYENRAQTKKRNRSILEMDDDHRLLEIQNGRRKTAYVFMD